MFDISGWSRGFVAVVTAVLVTGALLIAWATWRAIGSEESTIDDRFEFESRESPGEFAYLDAERVQAYLAQVQGGASDTEEVSRTRQVESGASIGSDRGIAVGSQRSSQDQLFTRRVITATDTSNYLRLLTGLRDPSRQDPARFARVDAASEPAVFAGHIAELQEGDFVSIENARVLLPAYARPFDSIRRLGSLSLLAEATGEPIDVVGNRGIQKRLIRYASYIGPNPRVILNLGARSARDSPPYERGGIAGCPADVWPRHSGGWPAQGTPNARVLVPIQYGLLADEFSLFSGGSSRVVGKVARVLREPDEATRKPRGTDVCYEDPAVLNTFGLGMRFLPDVDFVASDIGKIDKKRVLIALQADTRAIAPAIVVVPVAIVKTAAPGS